MKNQRHTPGPWEVKISETKRSFNVIKRNGGLYKKVAQGLFEQNAKLISTAPEMLEALIEIVNQWDNDIMTASYMMEVRKLIKKATE